MDEEIVAVYCLCDDFLKSRRYSEAPQNRMSDAEVMTVALVAVRHFGGNFQKACSMLSAPCTIPQMLSKSRLCRRLHALTPLFEALFNTFTSIRFATQCESGEFQTGERGAGAGQRVSGGQFPRSCLRQYPHFPSIRFATQGRPVATSTRSAGDRPLSAKRGWLNSSKKSRPRTTGGSCLLSRLHRQ